MAKFFIRLFVFICVGLLAVIGVVGFVAVVFATPLIGIVTGIAGVELTLWPSIGFGILFFVLFLGGTFIMRAALAGA